MHRQATTIVFMQVPVQCAPRKGRRATLVCVHLLFKGNPARANAVVGPLLVPMTKENPLLTELNLFTRCYATCIARGYIVSTICARLRPQKSARVSADAASSFGTPAADPQSA